jgi:NAD(P)-dependent dehydrogenase (short-subunit alcohol dehydrogenase family)
MGMGRLAVVTGANSGVGYHTTRILADAGWRVVMVCRTEERGREARDRILEEASGSVDATRLLVESCELSSQAAVRDLAGRLESRFDGLGVAGPDALVNNAGLYRADRVVTGDGFELTMAVNHLSHFLLTLLLGEKLRRDGVRIVNVSSAGHRGGKLHDRPIMATLRGENSYNGWAAYADSKQANVLFTRELDRRWSTDGVRSYAVHPGVLSTSIWDRNRTFGMVIAKLLKPFMGSPTQGGEAEARLVTDPDVADYSGSYYKKLAWEKPAPTAQSESLAGELWDTSLQAVGLAGHGR